YVESESALRLQVTRADIGPVWHGHDDHGSVDASCREAHAAKAGRHGVDQLLRGRGIDASARQEPIRLFDPQHDQSRIQFATEKSLANVGIDLRESAPL